MINQQLVEDFEKLKSDFNSRFEEIKSKYTLDKVVVVFSAAKGLGFAYNYDQLLSANSGTYN